MLANIKVMKQKLYWIKNTKFLIFLKPIAPIIGNVWTRLVQTALEIKWAQWLLLTDVSWFPASSHENLMNNAHHLRLFARFPKTRSVAKQKENTLEFSPVLFLENSVLSHALLVGRRTTVASEWQFESHSCGEVHKETARISNSDVDGWVPKEHHVAPPFSYIFFSQYAFFRFCGGGVAQNWPILRNCKRRQLYDC
jgi:hypothetical protein